MRLAKFNTVGSPKVMLSVSEQISSVENYQSAIVRILEKFPPANFISPFLCNAGIETEEFFFDFLPVQRLWHSQFRDSKFRSIRNRKGELVLKQIKHGRFNVVLFQGSPPPIPQEEWLSFRKKNRNLETVIAHLGHPFNPIELLGVDLILCASDELTKYYRDAGFRAETYFHSFPDIFIAHSKLFSERKLEFMFAGNSGIKLESHQDRFRYLQRLSQEFDCHFYLDNQEDIVLPRSKSFSNGQIYELRLRAHEFRRKTVRKAVGISGEGVTKKLGTSENMFESASEAVYGEEMFKVLGDSKLTVQIHTSATKSAGAMRIFESIGMGVCLVSDGANMEKILVPEREVVTFESEAELHRKCKYLLSHQDEMSEIALNGQTAVMNRHSNKVRAQEFLEITGLLD